MLQKPTSTRSGSATRIAGARENTISPARARRPDQDDGPVRRMRRATVATIKVAQSAPAPCAALSQSVAGRAGPEVLVGEDRQQREVGEARRGC